MPPKPLAVLLLTDADVFAGTERHILSLACALRQDGLNVRIGCPVPSPLAKQAEPAGIEVIAVAKRGSIDWRAALQLRRLIKAGRISVIHAHNGRTRLAAAIAIRGANARLIATQHFLEPAHTRRRGVAAIIGRVVHRWMNRRVHRFIAISNAVAEAMRQREHISDDRIAVVHNGLPDYRPQDLRPRDAVRAELNIPGGAPLIVCAARLEIEKDVASLITAMAEVHRRVPDAHCVIAGKGSLHSQLAAQIEQLGLQDRVRLLGFREDIPSLMNAGDCFVLPSIAEPFGLVLLEAMALSRPVIATRVAGPLEIVQDPISGLLVAPSDAPALSAAIVRLLADPATAAAMGERGRERFESQFTDRKMACETADVYRLSFLT